MTKQQALKLFEEKKVRTVWDDEQEKWYFSWEVTDLKVTFTQAEYYSPVSTPADFRQLTPYVFIQWRE